jgi:hypothetical protein
MEEQGTDLHVHLLNSIDFPIIQEAINLTRPPLLEVQRGRCREVMIRMCYTRERIIKL